MNKSLDDTGATVRKAFTVPVSFRKDRVPGQIPDSRYLMQLAYAKPKPLTGKMMLEHTGPNLTIKSVTEGLGFSWDDEQKWMLFLRDTLPKSNEMGIRKALYQKMREERLNPELRDAIFQRSMNYHRETMEKSFVVVTPDDLQKADRGGSYLAKVQTGEKTRYFYDEEKYKKSPHFQVRGDKASKEYATGRVKSMIEKAGENGCAVEDFKELAKKHGGKSVTNMIKDGCTSGAYSFKKGRFYMGKKKAGK